MTDMVDVNEFCDMMKDAITEREDLRQKLIVLTKQCEVIQEVLEEAIDWIEDDIDGRQGGVYTMKQDFVNNIRNTYFKETKGETK